MTATIAPTITKPGLYPDITDEQYHADPVVGGSLSSTGARRLLPPSCPAKFRYLADHPEKGRSSTLDFGRAAHAEMLGTGPELVRLNHDDLRTNAAKAEVAEAEARGAIPLKPAEYDTITEMRLALEAHPVASKLFARGSGTPEQTIVWQDHRTGIMRRLRLDWLPNKLSSAGRLLLPDYKTIRSAEPSEIEKSIHNYGYHMQGDWYVDGVLSNGIAESVAFLLVCQEKTPPYVVTVVQIHPDTLLAGHVLNEFAIETYLDCVNSSHWPGYSDKVVPARLPAWAETQFERARERGDYRVKEKVR